MARKFADNPTGDAFRAMEDDGLRWRCRGNIGVNRQGSIVSRKDLGPGAQIDYLMANALLIQVKSASAPSLPESETGTPEEHEDEIPHEGSDASFDPLAQPVPKMPDFSSVLHHRPG